MWYTFYQCGFVAIEFCEKIGECAKLVDFIEEYVVKDFSHDLDGTRRHVEQLVGQMMTTLANIRLARSVVDKVAYNIFSLL